jgi:hypothetical protein
MRGRQSVNLAGADGKLGFYSNTGQQVGPTAAALIERVYDIMNR